MKTSNLSFLSSAQRLTLETYQLPRNPSTYLIIRSEIFSRVVAGIFLSTAAALDLVCHTVLILPTFIYAIGKSIYLWKVDFTLPWQHLQRIQNAIAPLLLGSVLGVIHPLAGIVVSEATDKHAVIGMLSSNTGKKFATVCSPIHSFSIVERIAKKHRYAEINGVKTEIFSDAHIKALQDAKELEKSLEVLQAQEYIHKITNLTLFALGTIKLGVEKSNISPLSKAIIVRAAGLLVPILTTVDLATAVIVQSLFLVIGAIRLIAGRGPFYTETTTNPLMHISFLVQYILKSIGNVVGTLVWFISPLAGFRISLLPAHLFFKFQMFILMLQVQWKLYFSKEGSRFIIPISYGNGDCSALSLPTHTMHKTYLITEKSGNRFDLYWVNRPEVTSKKGLSKAGAASQIRSMLNERYPFMDVEKLMNYPVKSMKPEFAESANYAEIAAQGNETNCVVSNMFGMLETLDKINLSGQEVVVTRNKVVRKALTKEYGFYRDDFFPSTAEADKHSLQLAWHAITSHPNESI